MPLNSCSWLVVAFDSVIQDPSDYLQTEFDGLHLHIQMNRNEYCHLISTFLERRSDQRDALTKINRFLSAMAWKDDHIFITRGWMASGAREADRYAPRFNYSVRRRHLFAVISRLDFEHLQILRNPRQQLALALYREGLGSDQGFYKFLSFYKIINVIRKQIPQQAEWINNNVSGIQDNQVQNRVRELQSSGKDIGKYLSEQGRCAIAHAFAQPVRDPDLPDDINEISADSSVIKGLAHVAIESELGVPSMSKIYREHLYELSGFKDIFGRGLTVRLAQGQSVPISDFPTLPTLSIRLRAHNSYEALEGINARILAVQSGVVFIGVQPPQHPLQLVLSLDFTRERIELLLNDISIDPQHTSYTPNLEASLLSFVRDLFRNGIIEIYNSGSGRRVCFKDPFIPVNIDPHLTMQNFQSRIDSLLRATNTNPQTD